MEVGPITGDQHQMSLVEDVKRCMCEHGQQAEEIARLEALVYVPGVWRCAKCDFRLIQSNLNARDGTVTARDTPGDKCPNCASPLWRVTERQERVEALDMVEKQFERQRDWAPLAKALFEIERNPAIKDQAWFDFQGKAQRLIAIMSQQPQN